MTTHTEFADAVQRAAAGTPYVVSVTEGGFDVGLDIVDAQWFGLFNAAGLQKTYVHHVTMPTPPAATRSPTTRAASNGSPGRRGSVSTPSGSSAG